VRCHGGARLQADLDLRSKASLLQGGESGPAALPGSADKSLLWMQVAADRMPPGKTKLTAAEKGIIRRWIDAGISNSDSPVPLPQVPGPAGRDSDRRHWSFRKPVRPIVPRPRHGERLRNPIDAFILDALERKGLSLSPEADRLTLLRRACFDLTGLPPSPEQVETFLADPAPDAYDRLLDRLLASEHYGERWGRHWLDLAGYADSEGILDADYVRSAAWRYRDYVIRALNQDKPYDRFLKEQIAGDELTGYWDAYHTQPSLPPMVVEGLLATGFLRCAADTSRPDFVTIKNAPGYYYQTLDDTLKIVATSVLGLTVHCSKCHSHKYDPIPQTEYYRLQAIFMSAYRPYQWVPQVERRLLEATEAQQKEVKAHNAQVDAALTRLKQQLAELDKQYGGQLFNDRLGRLPLSIRDDVRAAVMTAAAKRNEVQKYLAGKFELQLRPAPAALPAVLEKEYPEYAARRAKLVEAARAEEAKRRTFAEIRALYDLPGEAVTHLLRRGDYLHPGPVVQPGVLSVLATTKPFLWSPARKGAPTSGRRLAFAQWLTQPDHPLTARVPVNRVWLHHFGEGLLRTPDDFGHAGSPPSHPELLDWLATEFVACGWSLKHLHRLIMTSSTYRQVSRIDPVQGAAARRVDPDNHLLWRQRLRRLEAEVLRDTILSAAGMLNPVMYGPPVPMQRQGDGEVTVPDGAAGCRRSVYLQVRRSQPLTLLQVFDQPVMETNCTRRGVSTVASQALTLLNSDFLVRQADAFANRVQRERPADFAGYAVLLAFGRPATAGERAKLAAFLSEQTSRHAVTLAGKADASHQALADLCHMLLSANELAYVD
jgi:hypothetical protein